MRSRVDLLAACLTRLKSQRRKFQHHIQKTIWEIDFANTEIRTAFAYSGSIGCNLTCPHKTFLAYTYPTTNLGDDIQTIAQLQHIPTGARIAAVDRELTHVYRARPKPLIANGWYAHNLYAWPMSDGIIPLFISVHIRTREILNSSVIAFLKRHQPIGCRDESTRGMLSDLNIDAYFSGCLTLTLRNPYREEERGDYVVICDAHVDTADHRAGSARHLLERLVPEEIRRDAVFVRHEAEPAMRLDYLRKSRRAAELLRLYARAKLVITTRLHCALPCLGFGTPVLFLHPDYHIDPRFDGLRRYLRGYDADAQAVTIDWDSPIPVDVSEIRSSIEKRLYDLLQSKFQAAP